MEDRFEKEDAEENEEEPSPETITINGEDVGDEKKTKTEQKEDQAKQEFKMSYNRETAIAYLYKKMPYNYFVYKRIFNEIKKRMPKFKPDTVLDFGAGLGSGAWAAQHMFPEDV